MDVRKATPKVATPGAIRELVGEHFGVHVTLKATQLQIGRNWLAGHMDDVDRVLLQLVDQGILGRTRIGRQVIYYERSHEPLLAGYWLGHGTITDEQADAMRRHYFEFVGEPTERELAATKHRAHWQADIVRRMADDLRKREDAQRYEEVIRELNEAYGRANLMFQEIVARESAE